MRHLIRNARGFAAVAALGAGLVTPTVALPYEPHTAPAGAPGRAGWAAATAAVAPGRPAPDLATATVTQVRGYFAALRPGQAADLARRDPAAVGNLDGAPYPLRYAANALALRRDRRPLPGLPVLAYDPRGDGRIAEVVGDLGSARSVAVLVPGVGWDLAGLLAAGGRAPAGPVAAARSLLAEAHRLDPAARVAAVVWLGYDPPERIDLQAVRSERAVGGAGPLARFVTGLPAPARPVLVCHSYGAVVCARAVRAGAPATDLVALAAPGLDVADVAALHTGARVWAARAASDPIRFTPFVRLAGLGHGADPTGPAFGARVLRTGSARGHDGYFAAGTESLTNLARIVLGRIPEVTLHD
jgi:Alpha/beta hydrolase